jgi:hypothetical protein
MLDLWTSQCFVLYMMVHGCVAPALKFETEQLTTILVRIIL